MNKTSGLQIRQATAADQFLLATLGAQAFEAAFAADNSPEDMADYLAAAFSPEKQAAELAEPGSLFIIAGYSSQPAGYARLKTGPAPECIPGVQPLEIARFYAHPAWVGRGVGAALMQACLEEARQRGCDVVWLSTWQRNPRGLAFYQKWGFTIRGNTTFQLGSDLQQDYLLSREV